ncbi:histidine phosphatase family protein [Rubrobacter aplysinae]|uniref:histidine phosphatase family protein n=1 Tax=Rubrobacter aplysinae TaxID=909625 RepID=UPI0013649E11|nr:histidine phosphatase family protein [Rubrobacter aplysinae]
MGEGSAHTHVKLVRHTQTDWNREGRYQSRSDRPLTRFGRARAEAAAARLQRGVYTAVVSSGLSRTDGLADLVEGERRERDERWREVDHGVWEGLTHDEVSARYGEQARRRFGDFWNSQAHGGESGADLWERVGAAWEDLLREHAGGRALVVTHGAPIRLLLCHLLGVPFSEHWRFRTDLGGVTALDIYPSAAILRTMNEVPPLYEAHEADTRRASPVRSPSTGETGEETDAG